MKEQDIQRAIIEYLHVMGLYALKVAAGSAYSAYGAYIKLADQGTPDLIISRRPVTVDGYKLWPLAFCEVKMPQGKLTDSQVYRLRELHRLGHAWVIATSIEDVQRFLDDPNYHGKRSFVREIMDENKRFAFQPLRGKKLIMNEFLRHERWVDKREIN